MAAVPRSSPHLSGGLEETYTDFDGWVTRRNWIHRHRPYQKAPQETPARRYTFDLQDSLVNGLCTRRPESCGYPLQDLVGLTRLWREENGTHMDIVLFRLLRDNGRRRLLLVNRSKL